jgi:hypothetical protein
MTTPPNTVSSGPSTRPLPLHQRAVVASVFVWIGTIGPIAMAASTATFGWSQSTSTARTGMWLLGGGWVLTALGFLAAGIAVIGWLRRARANAEALSPAPHRLSAGWAVGAWFVPVAAYVLPYVVVVDVVRAGAPGERPTVALRVWWAGWIGASLVLTVTSYGPVAAATHGGSLPRLLALTLPLQAALYITAAAAFTRLALRLAAWQDARTAA